MTHLTDEERDDLAEAYTSAMEAEAAADEARSLFAVLVLRAADRDVRQADIAEAAGCSKSAVHRAILRASSE